uniref:Uncharacterized protein n=1 Tax=Cyprinus carpio TaxID=7962 RepID=A0A8C1MIU0_CYPCA
CLKKHFFRKKSLDGNLATDAIADSLNAFLFCLLADDGKLSFEEFKAYFADGILTTDELRELFYSIDGRQTNNLDTDKLSDYFSKHLGEYLDVLSALEKLNVAVLKAMDKTKEVK